jgi:hypothetical protein
MHQICLVQNVPHMNKWVIKWNTTKALTLSPHNRQSEWGKCPTDLTPIWFLQRSVCTQWCTLALIPSTCVFPQNALSVVQRDGSPWVHSTGCMADKQHKTGPAKYSMSCVMICHVCKSAVKKNHFSYGQARVINPDGSFTSCSAVQYLAQHCLPPEPTPQTQLLGQFHWECLAHHTAQTLHLLTSTFSDNWRTLKRKNSDVMTGKAKGTSGCKCWALRSLWELNKVCINGTNRGFICWKMCLTSVLNKYECNTHLDVIY